MKRAMVLSATLKLHARRILHNFSPFTRFLSRQRLAFGSSSIVARPHVTDKKLPCPRQRACIATFGSKVRMSDVARVSK